MATTQVVSEVVSSPPPPTPPLVLLRTDWLFRNAERKGKAGQIFQAEVVPIRGLEPVNEGCPKEREGEKRKEIWLNSRGDSFCLGKGVRHQESAFIAMVLLAVKTGPLGPRLGEPARGSA